MKYPPEFFETEACSPYGHTSLEALSLYLEAQTAV